MAAQQKPALTQRAYTLRLNGIDPNDQSWRDALWKTHEAVNKGAKAFGDWLLTLRGGLDHTLADTKVKGGKGKPERDPTDEERKGRRILLALSWLSVESQRGAPEKHIIAYGTDAPADRNRKVVAALEEILSSRGVAENEICEWKNDCSASLSAAIREDAVWVNRSKAFDEAVKSVGPSLTRKEAWDMLERFFGSPDNYLAPAKGSEDESPDAEQEEKAKDLVINAGQWLSSRFGTGKGADFCRMAAVYGKIAAWADNAQGGTAGNAAINSLAAALREFTPASENLQGVLGLISGPGHKSTTRNLLNQFADKATITKQDLESLKATAADDAQKCRKNIGSKGQRPYADAILKDVEEACGFTYRVDRDGQPVSVTNYSTYDDDYNWGPARHFEFAVMLDHAARRVSLAHTSIKRAEAERRKFEEGAIAIKQVPSTAKEWLDEFCRERSEALSAVEPYRIRLRALDGWGEVVRAWSKQDCKTREDRIAAARALQDDPEIDKFGDIQLFEALAEDDAMCVWHKGGDPAKEGDPQPLIDYARAYEAEYKKRRFKVPAYCHPDALKHPVFCDFGNSRWDISFDIHEAIRSLEKSNNKKKASSESNIMRGLSLTLWTGEKIEPLRLCWQSKRLKQDLALCEKSDVRGDSKEVTRANRLGRAAANVMERDAVNIAGLYEQEHWNGRLQAPRQQLEAIAAGVDKQGWDAKAKQIRDRIQWLVTFSARLQPQGPWCDFAGKLNLKIDPQSWPHADANKSRKGHARLILSRLPGLRVLSVDLGHRYAAACAVWETLSADQVQQACRDAGHEAPKESDLYLHLKTKEQDGRERTAIYRRIGADTLPDRTQHPAPWARLDRQFLIKLQGEERSPREASNEEIWAVHRLESELGRAVPLIDRLIAAGWGSTEKQKARLDALKKLGWLPTKADRPASDESGDDIESEGYKPSLAVDDLMASAVRTMRLALKRHADRARIAHYLITDEKTKPGGVKEKLDENGRIDLLQDALLLWHGLFSGRGWRDHAAKKLWDDHIAKLPGYKAPEEIGEESSWSGRRKKRDETRDRLRAAAETLAEDNNLRQVLHEKWKKRWEADDGAPAEVDKKTGRKIKDGTGWYDRLRRLRDWLMPPAKQGKKAIRHVGGLSLNRLATLTEFRRKVQLGFLTRMRPDGADPRETKEHFGQKALDTLEHMRNQRVKQLASRIVEAALGIGSESPQHWEENKRPRQRIPDPRFAPCHAIVIEDLTHYRPEETRTRRENRQLMTWSSSKVKKYLAEACQLHGLHLREVSAGYTSRQDSRTGAPGMRCQDVPIIEFMQSRFWRKQVKQAEMKQAENRGDARDRFLCALNAMWKDKTVAEWAKAGVVRVPLNGGQVFVSADPVSPAARGLQADLNAAANIGLRALLDPDWPGKWWYVPCDPTSFTPLKDKVQGCDAVNPTQALPQPAQRRHGDARNEKKRANKAAKPKGAVNLWRDISSSSLDSGEWQEYAAYHNKVQCRVIDILMRQGKGP